MHNFLPFVLTLKFLTCDRLQILCDASYELLNKDKVFIVMMDILGVRNVRQSNKKWCIPVDSIVYL